MNKHIKWIVLGIITVPALGYVFYPMVVTPSVPIQQVTSIQPITPLPVPPTPQASVVIQLDTNAKAIIKKSNELVQMQLDNAIEKLTVVPTHVASYSVPDMTKTYLTDSDTGFSDAEVEPSSVIPVIDQLHFRGLIKNGHRLTAYLSFANNAPFEVHVGSTFQGVNVTHLSLNGITLQQGQQSRLLTGE